MSSEKSFTNNNIDFYLKELAKEYRRLCGKNTPAEIILIGGASILINYGFRDATYDMDAIISAPSAISDAINSVGKKYALSKGWINTDFIKTESYSPKLIEFSVYYKTFSNALCFRTIAAEYLVAMKLMAGRPYKNDLSDIVGIIGEHRARGNPLTYEIIDKAVCNLYGSWQGISADQKEFLNSMLEQPDFAAIYEYCRTSENQSKSMLIDFEQRYPKVLNQDNMNAVLEELKRKKADKELE